MALWKEVAWNIARGSITTELIMFLYKILAWNGISKTPFSLLNNILRICLEKYSDYKKTTLPMEQRNNNSLNIVPWGTPYRPINFVIYRFLK